MKSRIKDLITVFLIQLVLTLPFYTANVYGFTISNVRVTNINSNSAAIEWKTDNASNGKVKYGENATLGFIGKHDNFVLNHSLTLSNIDSDTKYFFAVESTNLEGNTTIDNNSNSFYTFRTTIAQSSTTNDSIPPVISNIDVLQVTDTSTKITWLTNENSTTVVLYGVNKTDKIKSSSDFVTNHSIVIDGLLKNTMYVFVAQSCDKANNCANSSNQSFLAGRDTKVPFINLSIPRFVNRRTLDIRGSTEPFSSVTLFVNNLNVPKRSLSQNEIGSSGRFVFSQMQLEQNNVIKIIMVDKAGNKNEKTFEVGVDTEIPVVQLNEIPSLTSKTNLTISGNVNEPVTIKVFLDSKINQSQIVNPPAQITGLNATKVGQNSVELHWNESKDKDFSHYAIYRDGVPIAVTKPANFNLFIDALADSGKTYVYEVSAIDIFANEGPKSEPITVATLRGGQILNLKPPQVDILEDFRKPLLITNASGDFNFGVKLNKGDGNYNIKLIFEDKADNNVIIEKTVTLDTKKPEVKIISPPSGAFIFENVANNVDIVGKTKPNARVHLFIDRTPFSFFNQTLELSGLPNEVQNLPEAQLDAKCRTTVSASFCRTGADFSVDADSEGNFRFKNIDLTATFGGAGRVREVPVTEFRDTRLEEGRESKRTTLVVIATDQTGQRGVSTQPVSIGTCWSGNQSWNVIPLTQYQHPTFLSTERFAEGTETIYFFFNYSYIGRGTDAKITGLTLSKACGTREILDPRFNISCQILPGGGSSAKLNKEGTLSYSAITLSTFPGMDRFLENDWKDFFRAINKELTFPFQIRMTYKHKIIDENGVEKEITETQTTCQEVSYVIDNSIIDPRKVLPDWLLFDFVDFLQDSIKTLNQAQEQINKVLEYVAVGCLVSFGLNLVMQSARRITSFLEEKRYSILNSKTISQLSEFIGVGKITLNPEKREDDAFCQELVKQIVAKKGSFKFRYVNDIDLKRCFPNTAAWWNREAIVYSGLRWSCDRVFGHASPSGWTESKDDNLLLRRIQSGEGCAVDQGFIGQPLKAEKCRELVASSFPQLRSDAYTLDDKCFKVEQPGKRALFKLGKLVEGDIYELEHVPGSGAVIEINHAIKRDEFNYLTAQSKTCKEICNPKKGVEQSKLILEGEKEVSLNKDAKGNEIGGFCENVDRCRSLNARDQNKKFKGSDGKYHDITSAETRGFTSDCFYGYGKSLEVISNSPSQREECCCINSKEGPPSSYYQPNDVDAITEKPVHESKTSTELVTQLTPLQNYADMKWSYRYWKEKFEAKGTDGAIHSQYNPNRYISGRDQSACFGANHVLYDNPIISFGEPEKVLTLDPFKDHVAAFQCVHIAGISQRIQFIKNLMSSLSTCLIQVRTTGRGDAGACKELFTQYLCSAIWQVIRAFIDGCIPTGAGIDIGKQDDNYGIGTYLKAGFKGVYESVSDIQSSLTQEYGNAKLNELLGTGEEGIVRKICLGAFGYDWEFNVRNLVDAAYATPFATLVQPITRSREFLTVNPDSLKPKYEYRASWLINPGCDFERYDVYLSCVGRKQFDQYPNSVNCGALGAPSIAYTGPIGFNVGETRIGGPSVGYSQCDCINLPDEKVSPTIVFTGRLKQNILEDNKAFHKVIDENVRYDHLKFVLRTDRKIPAKSKPNCFPQGYDDGVFYFPLIDKTARDIADCTVDYLSGIYSCGGGSAFFERKGTAQLVEVTINGRNANDVKELSIGDELVIGGRVMKTGKDKCLRITVSPDGFSVIDGITLNGTPEIPPITVSSELRIAGRAGEVTTPQNKISFELLQQNNDKKVTIGVEFISKDPEFSLDDPNDKVYVETISTGLVPTEEFKNLLVERTGGADFIIKKEDAKIKITRVSLNSPTVQGEPYRLGGVITIEPQRQVAEASQQKTISVEIFNIKDDRDSYNNQEDCSLSDRVVGRNYKITVSQQKSKEAKDSGSVIKPKAINPTQLGQQVVISAVITHTAGVKKADLIIKDAKGKEVKKDEITVRDGNNFEYTFLTDDPDLEKGEYKVTITAESRNGIKSDKSFNFKLI